MSRKPKEEFIEESIRLSSGVTVVVRAAAALYDTLSIQRIGGVVTVALEGAVAQGVSYVPHPSGQYVAPVSNSNLDAARAALGQLVPGVSSQPAHTMTNSVVSPESLGLPSAEEMGLLGPGAGGFVGRSNEDPDA